MNEPTNTAAPLPTVAHAATNHPALAATHRHESCDSESTAKAKAYYAHHYQLRAEAAAAFNRDGIDGLRALHGSEHSHWWGLAMTATYGPGYIAPSRLDENGRPTPETLEQFPAIRQAMETAMERIRDGLGV